MGKQRSGTFQLTHWHFPTLRASTVVSQRFFVSVYSKKPSPSMQWPKPTISPSNFNHRWTGIKSHWFVPGITAFETSVVQKKRIQCMFADGFIHLFCYSLYAGTTAALSSAHRLPSTTNNYVPVLQTQPRQFLLFTMHDAFAAHFSPFAWDKKPAETSQEGKKA